MQTGVSIKPSFPSELLYSLLVLLALELQLCQARLRCFQLQPEQIWHLQLKLSQVLSSQLPSGTVRTKDKHGMGTGTYLLF